MTSNPLQPLTPSDGSMSQPGSVTGSPSQSTSPANPKSPRGTSPRDEGTRTFRSSPEAPAASAARVGGSAEVLGYLNSISEFVGKARKALSMSSTDDTRQAGERQASDRQANERQSNEGGARSSPSEDAERTRSAASPL